MRDPEELRDLNDGLEYEEHWEHSDALRPDDEEPEPDDEGPR